MDYISCLLTYVFLWIILPAKLNRIVNILELLGFVRSLIYFFLWGGGRQRKKTEKLRILHNGDSDGVKIREAL